MASRKLVALFVGTAPLVIFAVGVATLSLGFKLVGPSISASVNPARSLGPALIVGHAALSQVWLFILAPIVGGALAALLYKHLIAEPSAEPARP